MKMWAIRDRSFFRHYLCLYFMKKDLLNKKRSNYDICYDDFLKYFKIPFEENEIKQLEISIKDITKSKD